MPFRLNQRLSVRLAGLFLVVGLIPALGLGWLTLRIAAEGLEAAARKWPPVAAAVNIHAGKITNSAVADTFEMPYSDPFGV